MTVRSNCTVRSKDSITFETKGPIMQIKYEVKIRNFLSITVFAKVQRGFLCPLFPFISICSAEGNRSERIAGNNCSLLMSGEEKVSLSFKGKPF